MTKIFENEESYKSLLNEIRKNYKSQISDVKNKWDVIKKDAKLRLRKISPVQTKIDLINNSKQVKNSEIIPLAIEVEKSIMNDLLKRIEEEFEGEELENMKERLNKRLISMENQVPKWIK